LEVTHAVPVPCPHRHRGGPHRGHDQPSELFTQDTFPQLLAFAQTNHPAWFSFWSANRDFQCPAGVPENWAPGARGAVTQGAHDFTKIIVRY
jgi:hypothetical protein